MRSRLRCFGHAKHSIFTAPLIHRLFLYPYVLETEPWKAPPQHAQSRPGANTSLPSPPVSPPPFPLLLPYPHSPYSLSPLAESTCSSTAFLFSGSNLRYAVDSWPAPSPRAPSPSRLSHPTSRPRFPPAKPPAPRTPSLPAATVQCSGVPSCMPGNPSPLPSRSVLLLVVYCSFLSSLPGMSTYNLLTIIGLGLSKSPRDLTWASVRVKGNRHQLEQTVHIFR